MGIFVIRTFVTVISSTKKNENSDQDTCNISRFSFNLTMHYCRYYKHDKLKLMQKKRKGSSVIYLHNFRFALHSSCIDLNFGFDLL